MDLNEILNLLGGYNGDSDKNKDGLTEFESIVDKYQMDCEYSIKEKHGEIIISEDWTSSINKVIKINRIYPFSISHIEIIQPDFRKEISQKVLDKYVLDEKYEAAAQLRDFILEMN